MGRVKISLDGKYTDKFLVEADCDLSSLCIETKERFKTYYMCMSPWNLRELGYLKEKMGLEIIYSSEVIPIVNAMRDELRNYIDAIKYRKMSADEINDIWEDEGFPIIFPKIQADLHQKRMVLWLLQVKRGGCYMEQGTGKTPTGIFVIGKLLYDGKIKKPLIFAPLSLLNDTAWYKDLKQFTDFKPVDLRSNKENVKAGEFNFINYDKLQSWCFQETAKAKRSYNKDNFFEQQKFDAIFYDESSSLMTHSSYRSRAFMKIAKYAKHLVLASGTPAPSNIFQLWPSMYAIGSVLGDEYHPFEQKYGYQVSVGPVMKWKPRKDAEALIRKRIDLVSYFIKREDAISLPARNYVNVEFDLQPEHRKFYDKIKKDFIAATQGYDADGNLLQGKAKVEYEVAMRIKLLQIISGFVTIEDIQGRDHRVALQWSSKMDELDKLVQTHLESDQDNNLIIWCTFRWEVETIYEKYKDMASYIYGGMSDKARNAMLDKWLNTKECRIMVAIPASAKFGHTWLKANASIYFSATENFEDHAQSRDRNYRRGQTRVVTEYKLISRGTIERNIWYAISNKHTLDSFLKDYGMRENSC